nr:TetR/AcrR family transcriptional regulator [Nocardia bovistercoris]
MHAAREIFSEVGYDGATFKDIAARAGVSRTNVNHHFHSKEELYRMLFQATRDSVIAVGITDAASQPTLVDRMSAFLRTAVQIDSADRTYARFIASSLFDSFRNPEFDARSRDQLDDVRTFIKDSLEDAVECGAVRPDIDVVAITEMLIAVMWGMSMYAGFVGTHDQLESVVDQFVRLLEGSLW